MPIYEYACDTCETRFERKQKFSDEPVRICPECGTEVRRVLYPAGIIFKGSGFYVTDNRGSNNATSSASSSNGDSPASSANDSSSSASSDAKSTSGSTGTDKTAKSSSAAADS